MGFRTAFFAGVVLAIAVGVLQRQFFSGSAPPLDFGSGSMFDLIANRYDMINRVLALNMDMSWRRRMVQSIQESVVSLEQPRILDIATGTADVAILLAQAMPSASIIGVDPSSRMLGVGQEKIVRRKLDDRILLKQEDAQEFTGLDDNSFDAGSMSFGIRNVPNRSKALCQIHRVLKPNSRFCILEFSEPDESFGTMGAIARFFIRNVIPFLGGILSGAPKEYWHLQNSIKNFPSPAAFKTMIQDTKCDDGSFDVTNVIQMNYGSVQLYVMQTNKETFERTT
jgi:demethylmenaquinone methyltransferase/2-methoxy-6-polyprenyl-1,4-benzoquinol methylase